MKKIAIILMDILMKLYELLEKTISTWEGRKPRYKQLQDLQLNILLAANNADYALEVYDNGLAHFAIYDYDEKPHHTVFDIRDIEFAYEFRKEGWEVYNIKSFLNDDAESVIKSFAYMRFMNNIENKEQKKIGFSLSNEKTENYFSCTDTETLVINRVSRQEKVQQLHRNIQQLTSKQQEAIQLCYFEGLTQEEAGKQINKSREAIEQRLICAHESLRKKYL